MSPTAPFRTIALLGNFTDPRVIESMQMLASHLHERGRNVVVDAASTVTFGETPVRREAEESLGSSVDLMVSIGGDGTLLHAARLTAAHSVPVLGVNRGRLGFLADIGPGEMRDRVDEILEGRYVQDRRAMLRAELQRAGEPDRCGNAFNDVVLQKWQTGRMLDFETWIDERYVNTHRGDGLVIATATGSTAQALSCGGPILYPGLDALVLAPICPHTLSDRPIVVPAASVIEIRLIERVDTRAQITCDGSALGELSPGDRLQVKPANIAVTLLHPAGYDYYRILRSKLRWGRGERVASEENND
ncbi:MAG: NAD(+) kinase [Steroidobacteraceae bacterium]